MIFTLQDGEAFAFTNDKHLTLFIHFIMRGGPIFMDRFTGIFRVFIVLSIIASFLVVLEGEVLMPKVTLRIISLHPMRIDVGYSTISYDTIEFFAFDTNKYSYSSPDHSS
jgi:hypothetical protein